MKYLLMLPIRAYRRWISPLFPPCCRYYPSCSAYALQAIERFGAVRGLYLAVTRILRCHPWARGGVDEVPDTFRWVRIDYQKQRDAASRRANGDVRGDGF